MTAAGLTHITEERRGTALLERQLSAAATAQLLLLALLAATVGLGPVGLLAGAACALVLCAALRRSRSGPLGPADHVTLGRAILAGGVTALVAESGPRAPVPVLVTLAAVALVLDAVDGQVARRTGTASGQGARLDMEVDAFLLLVLSVFLAFSLGPWVLAIGGMRYVFVAAGRLLPRLTSPLPHSRARKTVAALQGIILVVASAGVAPHAAAVGLVGLSLALLVWSFGRDTVWLCRYGR